MSEAGNRKCPETQLKFGFYGKKGHKFVLFCVFFNFIVSYLTQGTSREKIKGQEKYTGKHSLNPDL